MNVTLPVGTTKRTHSKRKFTHTKSDYTKDNAVRWFIILLVAVAAFIIFDTLSFRNEPENNYPAPVTGNVSKPAVDYAHHPY